MATTATQLALFPNHEARPTPAFSGNRDEPIHRWVPWIAGFSAEFVESTIAEFLSGAGEHTILDPFAGVGTTLVEAIRRGCDAIGFEINPYAALATRAKLESMDVDLDAFERQIQSFGRYLDRTRNGHVPRSAPPQDFRSRVPFFSPAVLQKVLCCLDFIAGIREERLRDIFKLAFGSVMVSFSNYSYEPSLTTRRGVGRPNVDDAPVSQIITAKLRTMFADIKLFQKELRSLQRKPKAELYETSFMNAGAVLKARSVDLIVTSPPYLNNYHYNRNTRPQVHWLGLHRTGIFEALEKDNIGKFWQTVREGPEITLAFDMPELAATIAQIRERNTHRGIYGGEGWANYAASYFNDTHRFLQLFKRLLKRRGAAVIVVGNSIIQGVNVEVDGYIGCIAESIGLKLAGIRVLRNKRVGSSIVDSSVRRAENTRVALYESAVILRKK